MKSHRTCGSLQTQIQPTTVYIRLSEMSVGDDIHHNDDMNYRFVQRMSNHGTFHLRNPLDNKTKYMLAYPLHLQTYVLANGSLNYKENVHNKLLYYIHFCIVYLY